jgi:uncharacterized damage-inducible protein DinB
MTTAAPAVASEAAVLRHQAHITHQVLRMNLEGVTQEESLIQPEPGGNCLNWVVGHLLWVHNNALRLLGQEPAIDPADLKRYERGSPPITDAAEARDVREMMAAWDQACERMDAGLAGITPEFLDRPAPESPSGDPNETNRTLLSTILFHQAYHSGQTGVLRRIAGKEGAIK